MMDLTVAEVAAAVGTELPASISADVAQTRVGFVAADSRSIEPGTLFVAIVGERVDGHRYVPGAIADGAVAALTSRPVDDQPCLVVEDPLVALGHLGRTVTDRAVAGGLQVLAITGSQGKTSTKDLLAGVLEHAGPTVAPYGNANNELGVPLTACRIDAQTRYLVSEMGARGIGHIQYLCEITPPKVAVVLNVGHAHVGEFGGQPAIAQAKGELVEALDESGTAVLNADDPLVWAMRARTLGTVVACSVGAPADHDRCVWAEDLTSDTSGRYRFRLFAVFSGTNGTPRLDGSVEVQLQSSGRHQVANAVAAAAAALSVGLDLELVGAGLSGAASRSHWRMELHERADQVLVINDSYNANPDSMKAALDATAEIHQSRTAQGIAGSSWAVLGDMLELGSSAADDHAELGRYAGRAGIQHLVVLGEHSPAVIAGAYAAGLSEGSVQIAADREQAIGLLHDQLQPGDVVLIKASRGLALEAIAEALVGAAAAAEAQLAAPPSAADISEDAS